MSNMVRSFMYWVEMLMAEPCEKEDVAENRHLRTWLIVSLFIFTKMLKETAEWT